MLGGLARFFAARAVFAAVVCFLVMPLVGHAQQPAGRDLIGAWQDFH